MRTSLRHSLWAAVVSAALLVGGGSAQAHAVTRGEWVQGANEICGAITDRNVVLVDRFERQFAAEDYKPASKTLRKVFVRGRGAFEQIGELDRPADLAAAIGRFVKGELRAFDVALGAARSLGHGRLEPYQRKFERSARIDRQAQREIRGFKPRTCFKKDEGEVKGFIAGASPKAGRVLFTKRADNICQKKGNDALFRIQRGVRYLEHRRLRRAGTEFAAAYRELRQGYRRIGRLHRPFHGHRHIAKWLHGERRATAVGVNAAVALRRHKLERAAHLTRKAAKLDRLAYKPMRSFKFHHCAPL